MTGVFAFPPLRRPPDPSPFGTGHDLREPRRLQCLRSVRVRSKKRDRRPVQAARAYRLRRIHEGDRDPCLLPQHPDRLLGPASSPITTSVRRPADAHCEEDASRDRHPNPSLRFRSPPPFATSRSHGRSRRSHPCPPKASNGACQARNGHESTKITPPAAKDRPTSARAAIRAVKHRIRRIRRSKTDSDTANQCSTI